MNDGQRIVRPEPDLSVGGCDGNIGCRIADTPTSENAPGATPRRLLSRIVWLIIGLSCVGLGTVGIVVPGLPTTVFFIAAAASFTRSSPRLEAWVLALPKIGPAVRDYRAGLGMPLAAKRAAVAMIVIMVSISVVLVPNLWVKATIATAGIIGLVVILRTPTRR